MYRIEQLFPLWVLSLFICLPWSVQGQHETEDSLSDSKSRKIDLFPAISYSPETKLTLGAIGYYYMDLAPQDPTNQKSFVNFLTVYTTAKQILIETEYDLFTRENNYRFRGKAFFNRYPDRNYGMGNDAGILLVESASPELPGDSLNYLRYSSDRWTAYPVFLRRITDKFYAGVNLEMEYLSRYQTIPEDFYFPNPDHEAEIKQMLVETFYSGAGLNLLYDSRDNILNPMRGQYLEFSNHFFGPRLGSDQTFQSYKMDLRQYLNPVANHTLALRGVLNHRYVKEGDQIPLRALSRVGGYQFIRGYFKGTYQDHHLMAFETEYRLPLWEEDTDSRLWQVWKRFGLVAFLSGAQVYSDGNDLSLDGFNLAAGGGVRILFNPEKRLSLRIDYAVGLNPDANGPAGRQSGLYFFLGEAF